MEDTFNTKKILTVDEAINEIAEILVTASGEWVAEIYEKVSGRTTHYEGTSIIITDE